MKLFFVGLLVITANFLLAQQRLSFVKDKSLKTEIQRSIDFLDKTSKIPNEVKSKIIFITFDIDKLFEGEGFGFSYSTTTPLSWSKLDKNGQFLPTFETKNICHFFNYSPNLILVFNVMTREDEKGYYFDIEQMKKTSNEIQINKDNLIQSEYFKHQKGNDFTLPYTENAISFDKKNNEFVPVRVNTFDLKTFMEVWYNVDVEEIPVSQNSKECSKKSKLPQ